MASIRFIGSFRLQLWVISPAGLRIDQVLRMLSKDWHLSQKLFRGAMTWIIRSYHFRSFFPNHSEGFSFYFGGLGVETCSLDAASATATVGNSRQWGHYGRSYGEFCKSGHFWRFQTSRSFVSCGRRGTLWHSNMFHNVSKVVFVWQAQYFCVVFRRWVAFFVAGTALWRTPLSFCMHGRCSIWWWSVACGMLFPLTLYTWHSRLYTLHFALHTLHSTPHSTLYTLHSTLHPWHFALHTLHSTLCTLRFTLHTSHFTLYSPHFTLHTLHCILHTLHLTLQTPHFTLHTLHFTLHTPHPTLFTSHSTLCTLHSTLYTLHLTLRTLHSTLDTSHSTLHTLHSTLYTLHSTLYTLHLTLRTLHSTLDTSPHSTL